MLRRMRMKPTCVESATAALQALASSANCGHCFPQRPGQEARACGNGRRFAKIVSHRSRGPGQFRQGSHDRIIWLQRAGLSFVIFKLQVASFWLEVLQQMVDSLLRLVR